MLADLSHPEEKLASVVHVAGTNGKGSLIAFLKAICEAAGLRVHAYTSPHLVRFAERISVAGKLLDEAALVALLEEVETVNRNQPITFFEVTTAAAYLAFARTPADVTLIETGLGGRFDATNVFASPAVCAITPVSMDHMRFLGDTLDAIAFEKAGILKPGVTGVIGPQADVALGVIETRAAGIGAPLWVHGRDWRIDANADGFCLRDGAKTLSLPPPSLLGAHQIDNAATAAVCARRLGIDDEAIAAGLGRAQWPGRLQRLETGRLAGRLGPGWELWLDGGHNRAAAEALAGVLAGWGDRPLFLVFGALDRRDPAEFLAPLAPHVTGLQAIVVPDEANSLAASEIAGAARKAGIRAEAADDVSGALAAIAAAEPAGGRVLICGSLYLAGAVLAQNETPP